MSVVEQDPILISTANGVTTVFPFDFYIAADADLKVLTDGAAAELNVDYAVTGAGSQSGGQVTFVAPPANGVEVTRYRDTRLARSTDYQDNGDLPARTINLDFDRLWLALQEIFSGGKGTPTALRVPSGEVISTLPIASERALKLVAFDLNGQPMVTIPSSGSAVDLALQLASTGGAAMIGTSGGQTVEEMLADGGGGNVSAFGLHAIDFVPADLRASVRDGTCVTDLTQYIKAAMAMCSNTYSKTLYFCGGVWPHSDDVFGCYDAALHPEYNILRNGEIYLVGEGIAPENGGVGGTKFLGLNTTGNGFVITPSTENSAPWRPRDFRAFGITFESNTTGFVVQLEGCPGAEFVDCEIVNTNAAGSGLKLSSSWFGGSNKLRIRVPYLGASTGKAIEFGITPGIYSGLASFKGLNVGGYAYGVHFTEGGWQNIAFTDSALVGSSYAFYCGASAGVDSLSFHDCYFEGACTSFIAQDGADRIKKLTVGGNTWMFAIGCTGPMIDLDEPNAVAIDNLYIQDPRTAILNIANAVSGSVGCYTVGNIVTGYPTSFPVPPFTLNLFTGVIPVMGTVQYPEANTYIRLCDPATNLGKIAKQRANYAGGGTQYAAHFVPSYKHYPSQANGAQLYLAAEGYPQFVWVNTPAGTSEVLLPLNTAGLPGGFSFTITNSTGSVGGLAVKSETGPTLLRTLAVGAQHTFVFYRDSSGAVVGWG